MNTITHNINVHVSWKHFDHSDYHEFFKEVNTWCRENCTNGLFRQSSPLSLTWQFAHPNDAMFFKLRWG